MSEHPPHDEFLRLCALAVSGQLSTEERKQLQDHLVGCPSCREAMQQYEVIARQVLPAMAPEFLSEMPDDDPAWSPDKAESALLERLAREKDQRNDVPEYGNPAGFSSGTPPVNGFISSLHLRPVALGATAALIILSGVWVYELGVRHGKQEENLSAASTVKSPVSEKTSSVIDAERRILEEQVDKKDQELRRLRIQLEEQASALNALKREQTQLENLLSQKDANADVLSRREDEMAKQLAAAEANSARLQLAIDGLTARSQNDAVQNQDLSGQIVAMRSQIKDQQDTIEQQQELLAHDRDIRELMGARDLYIAEVYDVASQGTTKKPYGRLFYTKGKSLIFYAYDLDQQKGLKNAATFQAWGRRGRNWKHATNLGVFYEDSAAKKRWVLRFDDPKELAEIDAVFVTVEPNGGSSKPSGKPLLFAYIKNNPNHP